MVDCKNCSSTISENFCANCGQPAKIKRIDRHYILHEIQHLLHVEKGFLYTAKELLTRPGQATGEYIAGKRSRHMKPIPFLLFASVLYTLIAHFFHVEEMLATQYINTGNSHINSTAFEQTTVFKIMQWMQHYYGYANIIAGGVIALWLKVFFRKHHHNIFEINILLCFIIGEGMIFAAAGALLTGLTHFLFLYQIVACSILVYTVWAVGQFFDGKTPATYIKALLAYILGFISFMLLAVITGIGIDLVKTLIHTA